MSNTDLKITNTSSKWATFAYSGIRKPNTNLKEIKAIMSQVEDSYLSWNKLNLKKDNFNFGFGAQVATFESLTGLALVFLQRSAATIANAATSVGEFVQVLISNTQQHDLSKAKTEKERAKLEAENEKIEERSEDLMSGVISFAGGYGIYKFYKDAKKYFRGDDISEIQELTTSKKITLSSASLLNAGMMFLGNAEKTTMGLINRDENGGKKSIQMGLNGRSDGRCTLEWLSMVAFTWFSKFKPIKLIFDAVLPALAFKDGAQHFYLRITGKEKKNRVIHPNNDRIFRPWNQWYFGNNENGGFRSAVLKPIANLYSFELPQCYMNNSRELIVKVPDQYLEKPEVVLKNQENLDLDKAQQQSLNGSTKTKTEDKNLESVIK